MPSLNERLAAALAELKTLQDRGLVAIKGPELSVAARRILVRGGYLQQVMRGWYLPTSPDDRPGDTTSWFISFWSFIARYLDERFGSNWCLSPEQSLALHVGDRTVPRQLLVRAPGGRNKPTSLAHETSVFEWRRELPPGDHLVVVDGLRLQSVPVALINAATEEFRAHPTIMRTALLMLPDSSDLLRPLIEGPHPVVAGRLIGALRNIGRTSVANEIRAGMESAGFEIRESDPFNTPALRAISLREQSPYVIRMQLAWAKMRNTVLEYMPRPPGLPKDSAAYLKQLDEVYTTDAYHSLSIEGYRVSTALIERVRAGNWNPKARDEDRRDANALAARGYWLAFQSVRRSIEKILAGKSAGEVVNADHGTWFRQMYTPYVEAGLSEPAVLAGYRNGQVFIRQSRHVPPSAEAVRDIMPAFFELLEQETEPAARAVLGHFFFVYAHPYMDGNGRVGRFLMNAALASGGFPWRVVPLSRRAAYMAALESASTAEDIRPFAEFIASLINTTNEGIPAAVPAR